MGSWRGNFCLNELKVLAEDLVSKSFDVDCLPHGLVHSIRRFFHFFVLRDQILLKPIHFATVPLNGAEFVVWFRYLNFVEDFEDFFVLGLHVDEAKLLSLVLTNKLRELLAGLNLVQTLDELISESFDPLNVLVLDLNESVADLPLPLRNYVDIWSFLRKKAMQMFVWSVLTYGLRCKTLDVLELLQLLLITLVDILEILLGNETLQTLIFLFLSGEESGWGIMCLAINSERTFRELLVRVHKESIVDYFLI